MSMPRFLNCRFPGFCQYRMEKKDFPEKMEALHDFPYFLISGLLTWFLVTAKQMLLKMLKSTIKTLEPDIKHVYSWNLKINIPEQHCQTVFCCFHCLLWMYFLPVLIFDFEQLSGRWECYVCILTIAIEMTINSSKRLKRTRLFLQWPSTIFPKELQVIFGNFWEKVILKFSSSTCLKIYWKRSL